jgi:hypothetical protein
VGLILILIGAHGLREALSPLDDSDVMEFTSYVGTYVNGFTFGLQPDALMVILPALALPSRVAAATFLGTFLLGTIGAMGLYAGCIGAASEALGKRMPWLTQVRRRRCELGFGCESVRVREQRLLVFLKVWVWKKAGNGVKQGGGVWRFMMLFDLWLCYHFNTCFATESVTRDVSVLIAVHRSQSLAKSGCHSK